MHILPVELISRIFELAHNASYPYNTSKSSSSDGNEPFLFTPDATYYSPPLNLPIILSHVSRTFRLIAVRTPALWTTLHFHEPSHISRAHLSLSRIGKTRGLDILISTVGASEHIPHVTLSAVELEQIFELLLPHLPRWRSFHLQVRDANCKLVARRYLSTCGPAPSLFTLQLFHFEDYRTPRNLYLATYKPPVVIFKNHLPNLRNVSLIGVNLPWTLANASFRLERLEQLEMALHSDNIRPPYDYWESMLRKSPFLKSLSIHYSGPRASTLPLPPHLTPSSQKPLELEDRKKEQTDDIIHLPHLTYLSLTDLDDPTYACAIFSRLSCPMVENLKLCRMDSEEVDWGAFVGCLAGSARSSSDALDRSTPDSSSSDDSPCQPLKPLPNIGSLHTLTLAALQCSYTDLRALVVACRGLRELDVSFDDLKMIGGKDAWEIFAEEGNGEEYRSEECCCAPTHEERRVSLSALFTVDNTYLPVADSCCPGNPQTQRLVRCPSKNRRRPVLPYLESFTFSGLRGDAVERMIRSRERFSPHPMCCSSTSGLSWCRDDTGVSCKSIPSILPYQSGQCGRDKSQVDTIMGFDGQTRYIIRYSDHQHGDDSTLDGIVAKGGIWVTTTPEFASNGGRVERLVSVEVEHIEEDEEYEEEDEEEFGNGVDE